MKTLLNQLKRKNKREFYSQQKRILGSFSLREIVEYLKANYEEKEIFEMLLIKANYRKELEL